jgi:membrane-bound serine protease (ClpP class)
VIPGALGSLMVLLAFFGLNLLPIHLTAVFLLVAGICLFVLEAKFPSHGALALVGTLCLIMGLATLVDGPIPEQRVHLSTAITVGLAFAIITFGLAWIAVRARRSKVLTGPEAMIGGVAIVRTSPNAAGEFQVEVRGELWEARLLTPKPESLRPGLSVRIRSVEGLVLLVEPEVL